MKKYIAWTLILVTLLLAACRPVGTQPTDPDNIVGTATPTTQPTKPQPTEPQPTEPKPTEPKPTEPKVPETQPSHSEETEATKPTTCQHSWQEEHQAEKGHEEHYVVCKCGYRCKSESAWAAHAKNYSDEDALLYHTSWGTTDSYVVDSPAYTEWVCSKCGATTTTKP